MKRPMKLAAVLLTILTVTAPSAYADSQSDASVRKARRKTLAGWTLVGIGAIATPITGATGSNSNKSARAGAVGVATVGVGTALLWSGAQDRRRAMNPHTTLAVAVGRRTAIQVQRAW